MHITQTLNAAPIFRYWKHFGAGFKRRQPNYKKWKNQYVSRFLRTPIPDHTIPRDMLPPNSRVLEAEELLQGHVDAMPEDLIERAQENVVYDHPWPYNANLDPMDRQELMYCYNIGSRFYVPREDCLVLTNTVLESDSLEAHPPLEPSGENMDYLERQFDWAKDKDSVLVRLPRTRIWPKVNIRPKARYGPTKDRKETHIMNTVANYAQMLLTKHYHDQGDRAKLEEILNQRSLSYPHCRVPLERQPGKKLDLDLFINSMLITNKPLPQIDAQPTRTKQIQPLDIRPRTWRSLLEQSRYYSKAWSFTLPRNAHLHTIHLNSQILRSHTDPNEMMARSIVHAFGVACQFARLRALAESTVPSDQVTPTTQYHASCILQDPLSVGQVNDKDLLDQPVVLQAISYDLDRGEFGFTRYQLNTLKFNDETPDRIKNQAWHSGPITSLDQALRYYLDFQSFDSSSVARMTSASAPGANDKLAEATSGGSS